MRARMSSFLRRTGSLLARTDPDALVPPVLLGIGAEQVHPGSGLLVLGLALYLPVLAESLHRRR